MGVMRTFIFPPRGSIYIEAPPLACPLPLCLCHRPIGRGVFGCELLTGLRLGSEVADIPRDPPEGGVVAPTERSFRVSGTAQTQGWESPEGQGLLGDSQGEGVTHWGPTMPVN